MSMSRQLPGQNRPRDEVIEPVPDSAMRKQLPLQDAGPEIRDSPYTTPTVVAASISSHEAAADPHPGYVKESATTVADASGGAIVDAECRAQLNALLAALRVTGAIGT